MAQSRVVALLTSHLSGRSFQDAHFKLVCKGRMVRVPPKFLEIHSGQVEESIDAHAIQPYYTVLLADEAGMKIGCSANTDEVVFTASSA